jgi:hypothetical protein
VATYNIKSNLKGAKFVLNSEKATSQGSSALIPVIVCAFDSRINAIRPTRLGD